MLSKLIVILASAVLASSIQAGLLPHIHHDQHEEHPLQKLSAGYEAPAHQYQVAEPEHQHQQQHQQVQHPTSAPPKYTVATFTAQPHHSEESTAYVAPIVRQQSAVSHEAPAEIPSQPIHYFSARQPRPATNVHYSIQPSHSVAAFRVPAVYEPHQSRAVSHYGKTVTTLTPIEVHVEDVEQPEQPKPNVQQQVFHYQQEQVAQQHAEADAQQLGYQYARPSEALPVAHQQFQFIYAQLKQKQQQQQREHQRLTEAQHQYHHQHQQQHQQQQQHQLQYQQLHQPQQQQQQQQPQHQQQYQQQHNQQHHQQQYQQQQHQHKQHQHQPQQQLQQHLPQQQLQHHQPQQQHQQQQHQLQQHFVKQIIPLNYHAHEQQPRFAAQTIALRRPQLGLIAPALPTDVAHHKTQPTPQFSAFVPSVGAQQHSSPIQYYSRPAHEVPAIHKSVVYSPSEAVSHTQFQSQNAQYSW